MLYRLTTTHFAHTHGAHYAHEVATPISMQLSFLRRTGAGRAVLDVQDVKLGARTSTIHVALLQESEKKKKNPQQLETKIVGYVTVSPASKETGVSARMNWELEAELGRGVDLKRLGGSEEGEGRDERNGWVKWMPPFSEFRKATRNLEIYVRDPPSAGPTEGNGKPPVIDQWSRFRPGGDASGRWVNDAVVFLVDMFPQALHGFDRIASTAATGSAETLQGKFWYPTVALNVDLKKRLPAEGTEWLYSRVVSKAMRDGRVDIEVVVLDEGGEVVAIGSQVGLVLSASRNVGTRQKL